MNNNSLLYFTNNEIPFPSAKLVIHNPSIKELGLISEESFRIAHQIIVNIPKELKTQDNSVLSNKEEFEIFIELMNQTDKKANDYKNHLMNLLTLLFPTFKIRIRRNDIQLMGTTENADTYFIDSTNFQEFQEIISEMFSSEYVEQTKNYNPADGAASKIAEKLKKRKMKSMNNNQNAKNISLYKRYASILSIGLRMDLNTILDYTVAQLEIQFKRYTMWMKWDLNFKMRCAGATDLDEVEDWMQEI